MEKALLIFLCIFGSCIAIFGMVDHYFLRKHAKDAQIAFFNGVLEGLEKIKKNHTIST
jgi:hypothetical protein